MKLVLFQHATLPPCCDESCAIAEQLDESGTDTLQSYRQAAVAYGGVDEDEQGEGKNGQPRKGAHQIPSVEVSGVVVHQCPSHRRDDDECRYAHGEDSGQEVHQFEGVGVFFIKVHACDTAVVNLFEEFAEVGAPLVPHPCRGEEPAGVTALEDADAEIDVLAETHLGETAEAQVDVAAYAHVVRPWVELVEFLLSATYASGGEETRHRVGDGLLCRGERRVRAVGTSEGIARVGAQFRLNGRKVTFGQHHVGVEHDKIFSFCPLGTVVAALSWTGVLLAEIMQVELAGVFVAHLLAWVRRPIFHHDNLEVARLLGGEAAQQLVHLVGAVVNGNDERVFHGQVLGCGYALSHWHGTQGVCQH